MHFGTKSYLKSTRNHTAKHALTMIEKNPYCEKKDARQADNQIHCRKKRDAHKKKKKT